MVHGKIFRMLVSALLVGASMIFSIGCGNETSANSKVADVADVTDKSAPATKSAKEFKQTDDMFTENSKKIHQGNEMFDLGNYKGAIDICDEIAALKPDNVFECNFRGKYFFKLGKYHFETLKHDRAVELINLAIKDFDAAIQMDSSDISSYINRGNAYCGLGEYEKAIASYDSAIQLDSDSVEAYLARGEAYEISQQNDLAMKDFNKAIELDPQNHKAYIARSKGYLALEQYDSALQDANKAIELSPNAQEVYDNRGLIYTNLKQYESAIDDYNKALAINRLDFTAHQGLGIVYSETNRYEEAIEELSKSIELYPTAQAVNLRRHCDYLMKQQSK